MDLFDQNAKGPGTQDSQDHVTPSLEDFKILTPVNHFCYQWPLYQLTCNMKTMVNTLLIAPRGFGKQQMVSYVSQKIAMQEPNYFACHLDLSGTRSLKEFIRAFKGSLCELPMDCVQRNDIESTPPEIEKTLYLPEMLAIRYRIKLLFTIGNLQVLFRIDPAFCLLQKMHIYWKKSKRCVFCLYGTLEQTRRELVQSRRKIMMGFLKVISLPWPDQKGMIFTIKRLFKIYGKSIREDAIRIAVSYCAQHPFYISLLTWHAFLLTKEECTSVEIDLALNQLIYHYREIYRQKADSLTIAQLNFLKAYLENWSRLCTREELKKYYLKSSSRVARIRESLCRKEIIGEFHREVYLTDPLFCHWLKCHYF